MAKGADTRERIVARAADVFSERGFFGSSMSDLLQATGLKKGGLYNHFESKEQLALASFDYAVSLVEQRYAAALAGREQAVDRLLAIADVIRSLVDEPALPGGCPVLTTAIEADDTMPALRDRARDAMTRWQRLVGATVKNGVAHGELRPGTDPYQVATVLTATLEGAVFLSKLFADPVHMHRAVAHVRAYVEGLAA
ncbi:MAG TPA: TetR/AcrR family transcriptional regulator [Mycobacteriales bacterium]|jgi:AcrR family transcriptional regulator|nr:TetR/AcrR family transcriptional regulator [Mycobacteriales bacterium]